MRIPHPIPYQGSKRKLAPLVLRFIPGSTPKLIEPFAGSAAISIAAALHNRAKAILLNDANQPLMALWTEMIERPEKISTRYERLWLAQRGQERQYYDSVREEFNETGDPACLLYLLARCVKAAIRYNADGQFNQSPDNRRLGMAPATLRQQVLGVSAILKGRTEVMSGDYADAIERCGASDLVYMDPPYQGVGGRDPRYMPSFDAGKFLNALDGMNRRNVLFILSYDGRTGEKNFGRELPSELNLTRIEIEVGRSSQATLLGRNSITYESLYLSPALTRLIKPQCTADRMDTTYSADHARITPVCDVS